MRRENSSRRARSHDAGLPANHGSWRPSIIERGARDGKRRARSHDAGLPANHGSWRPSIIERGARDGKRQLKSVLPRSIISSIGISPDHSWQEERESCSAWILNRNLSVSVRSFYLFQIKNPEFILNVFCPSDHCSERFFWRRGKTRPH